MLSFGKLIDLGSAAPHVYVMYQNISEWFTVDYLITYEVLPTTSHIYFHQPLFCVFFAKFDSFAGQLHHTGRRQTYNVRKILSPRSSLPHLAKTNPPCSAVSLPSLSYLFYFKRNHHVAARTRIVYRGM